MKVKQAMFETMFEAETIEHKTFPQSEEEILDKIKEIVNDLSSHMDCKPISVKMRQNHEFEDFCTRFKQKWVREKLGAKLKISFYGEIGIDDGGLSR